MRTGRKLVVKFVGWQLILVIGLLAFLNLLQLHATDAFIVTGSSLELSSSINTSEVLQSSGGVFQLGFYSSSSTFTNAFSLAIWYAQLPSTLSMQLVWLASREVPMSISAILQLSSNGNLEILSSAQNGQVLWHAGNGTSNGNVTAELMDSGNFVLKDATTNLVIWQSFDTPTDTLLPGQTIFANKTKYILVSAAAAENWTSLGSYQLDWAYLNGTGLPSSLALSWTGASIANWNRTSWSTTNASDGNTTVYPYWYDSTHADYAYLTATGSFLLGNASGSMVVVNSTADQGPSALRRMTLDPDGGFRVYSFTVGASTSWSLEANLVPNQCKVFAECGPIGICSPDPKDPSFLATCTCQITGFEPIDANDQYKGCQAINQLPDDLCSRNTTGDITLVQAGYFDYPYADRLYNYLTLNETACIETCIKDCRCAGAVVWRSEERCYIKSAPLFNGGFSVLTTDRIAYLKIMTTTGSGTPAAGHARSVEVAASIAGVCGGVALVFVVLAVVGRRRILHRRRARSMKPTFDDLGMGPRKFTYKELSVATRNFSDSEMVGSGGMGTVYKGILQPNGTEVAVKRLKYEAQGGEQGFVTEASSISQIRHRNLVQLQGWCYEERNLLLVYDYMVNGSLDHWLYESSKVRARCKQKYDRGLSWELRYSILSGVAAALAYLHEEWQQCVLHRDIKPSNVMLDAEFNPHLGDFGLARLIDHQKVEKTTMMAGTLGYMAPEMPYTGKVTKETDVYSFGVLVLEVVCGRHPVDSTNWEIETEDVMLVNRVRRAHEEGKLLSLVDQRIAPASITMSQSTKTIRRTVESTANISTTKVLEDSAAANSESSSSSTIGGGPKAAAAAGEEVNVSEALSRRIEQEISNASEQMLLVLRLGLVCCLPQPSARPSMRMVKQILSSGDATLLPPLPQGSFPFAGSSGSEFYPSFLLSDKAPLMSVQSLSRLESPVSSS